MPPAFALATEGSFGAQAAKAMADKPSVFFTDMKRTSDSYREKYFLLLQHLMLPLPGAVAMDAPEEGTMRSCSDKRNSAALLDEPFAKTQGMFF